MPLQALSSSGFRIEYRHEIDQDINAGRMNTVTVLQVAMFGLELVFRHEAMRVTHEGKVGLCTSMRLNLRRRHASSHPAPAAAIGQEVSGRPGALTALGALALLILPLLVAPVDHSGVNWIPYLCIVEGAAGRHRYVLLFILYCILTITPGTYALIAP